MDTYHVMELGRSRHAELIEEAQKRNRFADLGYSAFDHAMIWVSEQLIALGYALRQRYALGLSSAERA